MKTVIFLDVDGVLNNRHTKSKVMGITGVDPLMVKRLREIVDITAGEIVLSSTWKTEYPDNPLGKYLKDCLAEQGIEIKGITPTIRWVLRPDEILEWLAAHPSVDRVVILDDEDYGWGEYGLEQCWVDCSDDMYVWGVGIEERHVEYVRENLDLMVPPGKENSR